MKKRYVSSTRHTIQVDFDIFMDEMKKEMAAGKKRAEKLGNQLPIQAKAESLSLASHEKESSTRKKLARV